jgi:hypothetical protein
MDEFSVNRLSVMLDVDRQTLVRALKDTPADAGTERKPLFRVSTAVAALDQHRGKPDRRRKANNGGGNNLAMEVLCDRHFEREAAMRALPTLEQRREAARAMLPELIELDRLTRQVGLANGQDSEVVDLRAMRCFTSWRGASRDHANGRTMKFGR